MNVAWTPLATGSQICIYVRNSSCPTPILKTAHSRHSSTRVEFNTNKSWYFERLFSQQTWLKINCKFMSKQGKLTNHTSQCLGKQNFSKYLALLGSTLVVLNKCLVWVLLIKQQMNTFITASAKQYAREISFTDGEGNWRKCSHQKQSSNESKLDKSTLKGGMNIIGANVKSINSIRQRLSLSSD